MSEKRMLLVEDNLDDQELTIRAFKKKNIDNQIDIVIDGQEAIDYLFARGEYQDRPSLPVLILLDLKLPKIDGLEVLRQVRGNKRTKNIPVVVLTSSKEEQDIIESYKLGANGYVHKPVDSVDFVEAVTTLGTYWLEFNQPPPSN